MPDDIVLRLDRATAEDLYAALYGAGEHVAAGAPITPPTAEEAERMGSLLRDLGHALGAVALRTATIFSRSRVANAQRYLRMVPSVQSLVLTRPVPG